MKTFRIIVLSLSIFLIFSHNLTLRAETTRSTLTDDASLSQKINTERSRIEAIKNLGDDERKKALANLAQAASLLDQATQLIHKTDQLKSLINSAPAELVKLHKSTDNVTSTLASIKNWTKKRLESEQDKTRSELDKTRAQQDSAEKLLSDYITAAKSGGEEISDITAQLAQLQAPTVASGNSLSNVDTLLILANKQMLLARMSLLKTRQNNLGILTELATAQRDNASSSLAILQKRIDIIRTTLATQQNLNLKTAQAIAEFAAAEAPPELKSLQNKIVALLKEQSDIVAVSTVHEQRLDSMKRLLEELGSDRQRVKQVLDIAGDNEQISELLQKRLAIIPRNSALSKEIITYQNTLSDYVMRQLTLDEMLRKNQSATEFSQQFVDALTIDTPATQRETLRQSVELSWSQYHKAILDLIKSYNSSTAVISSLDTNTRQLLQVVSDYRQFISDKLLWMPSSGAMPLTHPELLFSGLQWLFDKNNQLQLLNDIQRIVWEHRTGVVFWLLTVLAMSFSLQPARKGLNTTAAVTARPGTDRFSATLWAIIYTLIMVLPFPLLLFGAGALLGSANTISDFTIKIAVGLQGSGQTLFFLLFLRQLCRQNGLAINHLGWYPELCDKLRTQANWLIPLAVPMTFFITASASSVSSGFIFLASTAQVREPGLLALGGVSFVALMILLSIAIYNVWRHNGPVVQKLATDPENRRWAQYHSVWFIPTFMLPLVFVTIVLSGYYYTATFFLSMAGQTLWFIILMKILNGLLMRRLYLTQRNLRLQEAKRERAAKRASEKGAKLEINKDVLLPVVEEEKIPVVILSEQVRQMVRTAYITGLLIGLWWIWKDVIPAFGFLDSIKLPITNPIVVDGVTKEVPLSLGSLIAGLIIGILTLLAARGMPGLLEFTLLQRLPISQASRYAITTLTQYTVVVIGLVISLNSIGLQWSSIQWLVAALSVGLGFGLQEIVANFVSGIILFFEQPIRIGDVVTISGMQGNSSEGISGTVSRIRIRATTIVLWGREEIVVPNKTFITGQLINWTLSNNITRIIVPVGVAYGSDVEKAMRILLEIAAEHPDIMKDPEPRASFEAFGDNSLNLFLRIYLNDIGLRVATLSDVCVAINDKFKQAGIVIAFPQRDLHIDSNKPLELVMRREDTSKA